MAEEEVPSAEERVKARTGAVIVTHNVPLAGGLDPPWSLIRAEDVQEGPIDPSPILVREERVVTYEVPRDQHGVDEPVQHLGRFVRGVKHVILDPSEYLPAKDPKVRLVAGAEIADCRLRDRNLVVPAPRLTCAMPLLVIVTQETLGVGARLLLPATEMHLVEVAQGRPLLADEAHQLACRPPDALDVAAPHQQYVRACVVRIADRAQNVSARPRPRVVREIVRSAVQVARRRAVHHVPQHDRGAHPPRAWGRVVGDNYGAAPSGPCQRPAELLR